MKIKINIYHCGEKATEGIMKHPCCRSCFDERFKDDDDYSKGFYEFVI